MPGFDQSGPMGQGSITGRRMGRCTQPDSPAGEELPGHGAGMGRGAGIGCGAGMGRGAEMGNRIRGWW